ncbi:ribosome-associated heat shock protein Hsp15 [Aliamphritea hakodatensis]|uniref:ribosome-associated heat shock protein Hsp15 n=1 Tax=Aliamphritea hakodatensis TaxID=2895352 RepID=UPI0022FDA950|nr:ribosome-associated heat shock protein Hsp15 [Aliamphritea hakodatensis]
MAKQTSAKTKGAADKGADEKVRLDKWLWAARFFKTRAVAKQAVEGGKVHYEGQRAKCSRIVEVGAQLVIRQGFDEKTVVIVEISGQRRGAPEAQKLYSETPDSQAKRELTAEQRKAMRGNLGPDVRPNKRDRRRIMQFKDQ